MKSLLEFIKEAEQKKIAIGHFNIATLEQLRAIFEAGRELSESQNAKIPLIIGTSEGEGGFVGFRQAAALVKSLKEEFDYPIFINGDHIRSLGKAQAIVEAGYDAIIFDASELPFEENLQKTKEAAVFIKSINPEILVEGEIGFIGSSSKLLEEIPEGAVVKPEDFTKPEEAKRFVEETKVDLLSPAVGSIHGMFKNVPEPNLDIQRIKEIKKASGVSLVLHGGSGVSNEDFLAAVGAGISIIHINTEIRLAWRRSLEKSLKDNPEEIAPYKVMPKVIAEMKKAVGEKLRIFNRL
ncbi:tagatose-bisphosphate aldolase [Candidatus Jorgensenbacteria bacterium RIFCSPLOWO2_12_FULL_42_11]|uniref:Tagatose-bisphosphate aldolase n=1 Tax=Candidatus Jorgensenbacteria bacterium RIFCSPLOWO2_12_FULL_42_11 TaxID=1798473 RepID=A0A1F6C3U3_9BACT|nr:MAG: tagatose-bisphosphate aldolase [Candidatus Jorgensenbacteria bacterium RIFCSPLOWO2_12_FULL_42_11]